jgi:hypothetical protein
VRGRFDEKHLEVRKAEVAVIERNCIEGGEEKIAPYLGY